MLSAFLYKDRQFLYVNLLIEQRIFDIKKASMTINAFYI